MAEVITRLKLETTQYDSQLRNAANGLSEFAKNASKAGSDFQKLAQGNMEAARSFGDIATTATNTKDKLKELVTAYNDVAKAYNSLTQEQQQSDFGKAMSQSLETLKGRISETKQELYGAGDAMKETGEKGSGLGGVMDSISKKSGISVSSLGKLTAGLSATGLALKVVKDAFFSSESNVDDWGRTVASARAVYDSFVNALNTGNFSGFFSRLDSVIRKAREAYDALDNLNTVMTIINPERAKLQARQTQLQTIIRREGANSDAGRQAQQELKELEPRLQKAYRTEAGLNWIAFEKEVESKLAKSGIVLTKNQFNQLMTTFHDEDNFEKLRANARGRITYVSSGTTNKTWNTSGGATPAASTYQQYRKVDTRNVQQKILDTFTDEWRQQYSPYLTASFNALGQSYNVLKQDARYVNQRGGGAGRTGGGVTTKNEPIYVPVAGSIDAYEAQLQTLNKQFKAAADDDSRAKIKVQIEGVSQELDRMNGKIKEDAPVGSMAYYTNWLKELQEKQQLVTNNNDWEYYAGQIEFVTKQMKNLRGETEETVKFVTGISGMSSTSIGRTIKEWQGDLSGMDIGSEAYMKTAANILDATTFQNLITEMANRGISMAAAGIDSEALWDAIVGGDDILDNVWQTVIEQINKKLAELGKGPIQLNTKTGSVSDGVPKDSIKDTANLLNNISSATGSIMNGIEKLGIDIPDGLSKVINGVQIVAGILTGISSLVAIITTIQGAKSVPVIGTFLAGGGIVPHAANGMYVGGRRFSSDLTPVWANAGELILNKAAQGNIASQLTGGMGNMQMEAVISGEQIRLVLNNNSRRHGRGEYITSR